MFPSCNDEFNSNYDEGYEICLTLHRLYITMLQILMGNVLKFRAKILLRLRILNNVGENCLYQCVVKCLWVTMPNDVDVF